MLCLGNSSDGNFQRSPKNQILPLNTVPTARHSPSNCPFVNSIYVIRPSCGLWSLNFSTIEGIPAPMCAPAYLTIYPNFSIGVLRLAERDGLHLLPRAPFLSLSHVTSKLLGAAAICARTFCSCENVSTCSRKGVIIKFNNLIIFSRFSVLNTSSNKVSRYAGLEESLYPFTIGNAPIPIKWLRCLNPPT